MSCREQEELNIQDKLIEMLEDCGAEYFEDVSRVNSYEDAGICTNNAGLVAILNGTSYQISIVRG